VLVKTKEKAEVLISLRKRISSLSWAGLADCPSDVVSVATQQFILFYFKWKISTFQYHIKYQSEIKSADNQAIWSGATSPLLQRNSKWGTGFLCPLHSWSGNPGHSELPPPQLPRSIRDVQSRGNRHLKYLGTQVNLNWNTEVKWSDLGCLVFQN